MARVSQGQRQGRSYRRFAYSSFTPCKEQFALRVFKIVEGLGLVNHGRHGLKVCLAGSTLMERSQRLPIVYHCDLKTLDIVMGLPNLIADGQKGGFAA